MSQDTSFFSVALEKLAGLSPNQKPEWGNMTPQHMVEHLVGTWMISNGRAEAEQVVSDEEIDEKLAFLRSDIPFAKNLKSVAHKNGALLPLRKNNVTDAVEQLRKEMLVFDAYFEEHPEARPIHPVFGPLDRIDWLRFQEKHMRHHLRQFNLM